MSQVPAVISKVKNLIGMVDVKTRFNEILGDNASSFMASIVNTVSGSKQLQKCDPNSIMSAAFIAAALDLPIDPNLGFAAIVPYGSSAQFQIQWKGFVQLAIRTGEYSGMNVESVYEDELVSYNPIVGDVKFVDVFPSDSQRSRGEEEKIVGYYAWISLKNGFHKPLYMSVEEVDSHARKYSKSYQYDLRDGKKSSMWSKDFNPMAKKTLIKLLLSKWGIMSTKMKTAVIEDQKVFYSDSGEYIDNPSTKALPTQAVDALGDHRSQLISDCEKDITEAECPDDLDCITGVIKESVLSDDQKKTLLEKIELRKGTL